MRHLKRSPVVAVVALVAMGVGDASGAHASTDTSAAPALCSTTGPIEVTPLLGVPVNLSSCPIVGHQLVQQLADGSMGAGVPVPAVGDTLQADLLTTSGDYAMTATNNAGVLTVSRETPPIRPAAAAPDPACSQTAYKLLDPPRYWTNTLTWSYNSSTTPSGLSATDALTRIRNGNTNMSRGINNCGRPEGVFSSVGAYQGDTSRYANVDAAGNCTPSFPDGYNTESWQTFNSPALLALTCTSQHNSAAQEADTGFAQNPGRIVTSLTASCSNQYDLESVATHEWGHSFGLDDLYSSNATNLVMYGYKTPCVARRHLGSGDYSGMDLLYGPGT